MAGEKGQAVTHKQVVANIVRAVRLGGGAAHVLHQGPGVGRRRGLWGGAGLPVLRCYQPCDGGKLRGFRVEVKTGRDRLRPAQMEFQALARRAGDPVIVARSAADVLAWKE